MRITRYPCDENGKMRRGERSTVLSLSGEPARVGGSFNYGDDSTSYRTRWDGVEVSDWAYDPEKRRPDRGYGVGTMTKVVLTFDEVRAAYAKMQELETLNSQRETAPPAAPTPATAAPATGPLLPKLPLPTHLLRRTG